MSRVSCRAVALLCACWVTAAARFATGDTAPRAAWVTMAGSEGELDALTEALREPLRGLGLTLRVSRSEAPDPSSAAPPANADAPVRVWVDTRPSDHIDLVLWAGPSTSDEPVRRVLSREVPRPSEAVEAEEIAYAVRAALESLLTQPVQRRPAVTPPEPTLAPARETQEPVAAREVASDRRPVSIDLAAFGSGHGLAASTPTFGGGGAVEASLAGAGGGRWRPGLWLGVSVEAPTSTTASLVSLSTTLVALRLVPTIELVRAGSFRLGAGAGAGLDLLRVIPSSNGTEAALLASSSTYVDPVLEAQVTARLRLVDGVGLFATAALDYDTAPHRFREQVGSTTVDDVLAPWSVRPSLSLGVCIPLAAASKCAREP